MDALDDEMRALLAPHFKAVSSLLELPSAYPNQDEEWEQLLAAGALACAGLTAFLKDRFEAYFDDSFDELLCTHYRTTALAEAVSWEEAEETLRRHQVTGGLTPQRRRQLFEAHRDRLRNAGSEDNPGRLA